MTIANKYNSYPSVLIIVPNKDGINHLSYSLESISKSEYPNLRVVMVDNCSNDGSVEYVQQTYPEFEIIRNKTDAGFAGAVNRGLLHGLKLNAKYLVVFSNDVRVHPQWLLCSIKAIENWPECGIAGFLEINKPDYISQLKIPSNIEVKGQSYPNCVAIYILRAELIMKVGLYDEDYYMYGEDNDFFYRCSKAGYKTLQTNIPVWHKGEGFSESLEKQQLVTMYVYRNWLRFAVKNYDIYQIILVIAKIISYAVLPRRFWRNKLDNISINRLVRFNFGFRVRCLINSIFFNVVNVQATKRAKLKEREWIKKHSDEIMPWFSQ